MFQQHPVQTQTEEATSSTRKETRNHLIQLIPVTVSHEFTVSHESQLLLLVLLLRKNHSTILSVLCCAPASLSFHRPFIIIKKQFCAEMYVLNKIQCTISALITRVEEDKHKWILLLRSLCTTTTAAILVLINLSWILLLQPVLENCGIHWTRYGLQGSTSGRAAGGEGAIEDSCSIHLV